MKKEIKKQLEKAYIAISHTDTLNETRVNPDSIIRNKVFTIKELIKECLEQLEANYDSTN